jgi:hypothetical protein
MILIWGFRVRSSTVGTGQFFCPPCGGDRAYNQKTARRWFTLFFIPLIPLKVLGEYYECATCKSTYSSAVLSLPTTATMQSSLFTAGRIAIVWLLRVSGLTPAGEAAALEVLSQSGGQPFSSAALHDDLATLEVSSLPEYLAPLAGTLNEQGKESFLASCTGVAAANGNGNIDGQAREVLDAIAGALSMTAAHARGVIDQTLERRGSA